MEQQKADRIITEYLQKIYGFAVKKCFSYDEAEDLAAEIVKEVYRSLLHAHAIDNLDGYIWRISEHTYAKHVAAKKKHESISTDGMEIPSPQEDPDAVTGETLLRLRREIAFLTKKRREIVYAYYYEHKTIPVIAKMVGMPEGTVKWHLSKARNEMKEGFPKERKIGRLGLSPIDEKKLMHSGRQGRMGSPAHYLQDKLNVNIVYSVYFSPKNIEEIAEELGVTPVYIEDKIDFLEENGFLVRTAGGRFTTCVHFTPQTYSLELEERIQKYRLAAADVLAKEYVPVVRKAIADVKDVYIPSGNRELLDAAAVFYGIMNSFDPFKDKEMSEILTKYMVKTTDGARAIIHVYLPQTQSDPEYTPTLDLPEYTFCGAMYRRCGKYPGVSSWSVNTRYSSRAGNSENNTAADYDYVYEYAAGTIRDTVANAEKFHRLRQRQFLTEDGRINIMMVKDTQKNFFAKIPKIGDAFKKRFADSFLESAMIKAREYPSQMQDLVVAWETGYAVDATVALMVMDILYGNGTFRPLTEQEKVTSNLIMFTDMLPQTE